MEIRKNIKLDHNITYNDQKLCEKFYITDEREKEELRDIIYKYDLIRIFELDDFLEEIIIDKINDLYNIMIQNNEIKTICSSIRTSINAHGVFKKTNANDDFENFMILFSYDYLHVFYPCICDFFKKGIISHDKLILLKNSIVK
jgi:hypothetical protein